MIKKINEVQSSKLDQNYLQSAWGLVGKQFKKIIIALGATATALGTYNVWKSSKNESLATQVFRKL